ncbi:hypothetical protein L1049_019991 [Liquidambar formosana]|uniref:Uncharacterized protein n=1 Tax=Liquidambar formosana TaxID=63359 RepID=A0AAP0SC47_LIQFO
MGFVNKEKPVLKLVRPGRIVEFHKTPITAAEVMKKYPRHCVTRPDVFQYPWIAVRPESVLKPGAVFFIVPYHTMHRLLQKNCLANYSSRGQRGHAGRHHQDGRPRLRKKPQDESPAESDSAVEMIDFHHLVKKQSPNESWNKENHKHENRHAGHLRSKYVDQSGEIESPVLIKSHGVMKTRFEANGSRRKQYPVERWPTLRIGSKNHLQKCKPETPEFSFDVEARDYPLDHSQGLGLLWSNHDEVKLKLSDQASTSRLKSCLKKHKHNSSKSGLRVTFAFPDEDEKELRVKVCETGERRVKVCETEFWKLLES